MGCCCLPAGGLQAEAFTLAPSFARPRFFAEPPAALVSAVARDGQGRIYLVGGFTGTSGFRTGPIIRMLPNGSVDESFVVGPTVYVARQPVFDSAGRLVAGIILGSDFSTPVFRLARFLENGDLDPSFANLPQPNVNTGPIVALADGKLLVVLGSQLRRFLADGTVDTTFTEPVLSSGSINCLAVDPTGRIYVAGSFTNVSGNARRGVVRLLANGTVDSTFVPPGSPVMSLSTRVIVLTADGKVVLGGQGYNPGTAGRIVIRLMENGALDSTFNSPGNSVLIGGPREIVQYPDGALLLIASSIYRLLADGTVDPNFPAQVSSSLTFGPTYTRSTVLLPNNTVLVPSGSGYAIHLLNNMFTPAVVSLGVTGVQNSDFQAPGIEMERFDLKLVRRLDSKLLVFGNFDRFNLLAERPLVLFDANGTLDESFGEVLPNFSWPATLSASVDGAGNIFATFLERALPSASSLGAQLVKLNAPASGGVAIQTNPALPFSSEVAATPSGAAVVFSPVLNAQEAVDGQPATQRLLANGSRDPSWSGPGTGLVAIERDLDTGFATRIFLGGARVALTQPEGRMLAIVLTSSSPTGTSTLVRWQPDGSVDPTFTTYSVPVPVEVLFPQIFEASLGQTYQPQEGVFTPSGGITTLDRGPDGSIVLAGSSETQSGIVLAKLSANGQVDLHSLPAPVRRAPTATRPGSSASASPPTAKSGCSGISTASPARRFRESCACRPMAASTRPSRCL